MTSQGVGTAEAESAFVARNDLLNAATAPASASHPRTTDGPFRWSFVLVAAVVVLYLLDIPFRDFWSQNEGRYALGAASILKEGRWLVPNIIPGIDADKPPLFFWFVAAISVPFGQVTDWTPRLANLLAALAVMGVIYRFGRMTRNQWVGLLSAVMLVTSYEFWEQAVNPGVDILLTALLTVTWAALYRMLVEGFTWRRWAVLWIFMGLAFLTKGPLALILSGLVAMVFAWWQFGWRDGWRRLLGLRPFTGAVVACAPFAIWAGLVYAYMGAEPLKETVIRHNFVRFFHAFDHARPWYYLLYEMPLTTMPWSLLLPFALWYGIRARRARKDPGQVPLLFSASVVLVVVGFFSLSSSKQDYYLLPLIPWFSYAMSVFVWDRFRAAAPSIGSEVRWTERDFARCFFRVGMGRVVVALLSISVLVMVVSSTVAAAKGNKRKSPLPLVAAIDKAAGEDDRLIFLDCDNLIIFFYLNQPYEIRDTTPEELAQVRKTMEEGCSLHIVIETEKRHHLAKFDGIPLYVEAKKELRRKTYYILTNERRPGLKRYS